jgi:alpha-L-fucosidase 2
VSQLSVLIVTIFASLLTFSWGAAAAENDLRLWYTKPALKWDEALPVGNGRLGAMVFGGITEERIQFNEDTCWTGVPHDYVRPGAIDQLAPMRKAVFEDKPADAAKLSNPKNPLFLSDPIRQKAYQPFGDLYLRLAGHEAANQYSRELDLTSGVAKTSYHVQNVHFQREVFASYPDHVIVVHLTADQPGRVTFALTMDSPHKASETKKISPDTIELSGQVKDLVEPFEMGVKFDSRLRVVPTGGKLRVSNDGSVNVDGADSVTLLLAAATSVKNFQDITANPAARCEAALAKLENKSYDAIRKDYDADFHQLFDRVKFDLGRSDRADLPTDQRLQKIKVAANPSNNTKKDAPAPNDLAETGLNADPALVPLFFEYGRYLLISSSRAGGEPANLQGVWNDQMNPPWESKYTTNINLEMNYWPAEVTNLSDCTAPLFDMIDGLVISGSRTAKEQYGARGWVLHHNTDLWRGTAPINNTDGDWPTGAAWLCQHLWDHWEFTGDKDFLAKRAYPAMKQASLFFVDYLVKDPRTGYLVTNPSFSPEQGELCAGPTMDNQLIRALFNHTIEASEILGVDNDFAAQVDSICKQLPPNQVGKHGQLQEWQQDVDQPNNNHRHMSPLWAMYPGNDITPDDPKIFDAAKVLLGWRGDGSTGWSFAWRVPLWARAGDGDMAFRQLYLQLAKRTLPNCFDLCGPFQIDGNFGETGGIPELLLQSHRRTGSGTAAVHELDLLPALPKAWPSGSISGLCARGGFDVDETWNGGKLTHAVIHSKLGSTCKVSYGGRTIELSTQAGKSYELNGELAAK